MKKNISLYEAFYEIYFNSFLKLGIEVNEENILYGSNNIIFNCGVIDFFKELANSENEIFNYIITSGIEMYVSNSVISNYITEIYGTKLRMENGVYVGTDFILDDKQKPSIIEKIIKNKKAETIVYIGDGLTDEDVFRYVKSIDGISIFVGEINNDFENYKKLEYKGYVDKFFKKDFSNGSELRNFIISLNNSSKKLYNVKL